MPGKRNTTEAHWQTIRDHGFSDYFVVDLMDEEGSMKIAAKDRKHIKYDIVGNHLPRYDYMINLAHFKGHQMGGFGGVLKNASIGVASSAGKVSTRPEPPIRWATRAMCSIMMMGKYSAVAPRHAAQLRLYHTERTCRGAPTSLLCFSLRKTALKCVATFGRGVCWLMGLCVRGSSGVRG